MTKRFCIRAGWAEILVAAVVCWSISLPGSARAAPPDGISWDAKQDFVDAQIEAWPLARVLVAISAATGWQIYVEPDTRYTISTRFQKLKPPEALRRLLGELNFALLPQTNAPAKFFVYRTTVQEATQLIAPPPGKSNVSSARPIPNELVVTLKPGAKVSIEDLAKRLGAKVVGRIDELNAYRLRFESEDAAQSARSQLAEEDAVSAVDSNFAINRPTQIEPLSISSVPPLSLKPNVSPSTEHPVIALIDTSVAGDKSPVKDFFLPQVSVADPADATVASRSHGEAMGQTILRGLAECLDGPATTAWRILPVDVYGNSPSTTTFDVARGIYAALGARPSIFNLSLGSEGDTPFLKNVIQQLHDQGAVFVAATGNQPVRTPMYPAAYDSVLAVTAGDSRGRLASYANRGDFVDVIAPGASIVDYGGQAFLTTGTSVSAAHMSGMIACLLAHNPDMTPLEAEAEVRKQFAFQRQ